MSTARVTRIVAPDAVLVRSRRWSLRWRRRTAVNAAIFALLLVVLFFASLVLGDFIVTPGALVQTLSGHGPDSQTEFFVLTRRMPRVLVAMVVGACLGLAGAIFQTLTRNPLASPDVVGVSGGASVGGVVAMLVLGGGIAEVGLGALIGAVGMAALIMLLSARGGLHGVRLILTGIGLAAVASAAVDYVLSQVFVASATTAQTWLVGSLAGRSWDALAWPLITLGVVSIVLVSCSRETDTLLIVALTGAALFGTSDLVALYAFPAPLPVGAVTVSLGGGFFLWLLWVQGRRERSSV